MIYGLSDKLDTKKGWGVKDDTFNFLNQMKDLGMESWFNLGDKDLTTHVLRTKLLKEGNSLSKVTDEITKMYGIDIPIFPATDTHVETNMEIEGYGRIHLQEYWIKHKSSLPIKNISYQNINNARVSQDCIKSIKESELIVFAPGNPVSSIGPIVEIPQMKKLLHELRKKVVMVSPFISRNAISGPSEIYMRAKSIDPSLRGLTEFYSKLAGTMIFDNMDQNEIKNKIQPNFPNTNFCYADILMSDSKREIDLAKYITSNFR